MQKHQNKKKQNKKENSWRKNIFRNEREVVRTNVEKTAGSFSFVCNNRIEKNWIAYRIEKLRNMMYPQSLIEINLKKLSTR